MKVLQGIAGAPGVTSAPILYYEKKKTKGEKLPFDQVAAKALEQVRALREKTFSELGEEKAKIFSAYEMLLEDPMLMQPIGTKIEAGTEEREAVLQVTEEMASVLAAKKNEYLRQRADDIRYIGTLLCDLMDGAEAEFSFPAEAEQYIIAARELTPVDTMLFDRSRLAGLVTQLGGAASHTVILAKSLGIPAVVGVHDLDRSVHLQEGFLDGYQGRLTVAPEEAEKQEYEAKIREERRFTEMLTELKQSQAKTADGCPIAVAINIGKPSDLRGMEEEALCGVGLFRTEFLYSSARQKPTVEEQIAAYREVIEKVAPESVTIRTLDIGGDKKIDYLELKQEENPFLGNRGIRLCLNHPDLFREQLRALLIAGAKEGVKLMLPMVTCLSEVRGTKELIASVIRELEQEGIDCCRHPKVGIMIETPAAAIMADVFADQVDFFSIGTNDLVQYLMAADRGNGEVEALYNPYHPAVLRMIAQVIRCGERAGIEVSVCGDLAANTEFTELLIGFGLKKFSVPLPMTGRLKYVISTVDTGKAKELAERVLGADETAEIKKIMKERGGAR